jgi:anti-sigma factor ChrR (cupin superfamily)
MSTEHAHDRASELVFLHALSALPAGEAVDAEAHAASCATCRTDLERLREVVGSFVGWPTDLLRPRATLWDRIAARIASETGKDVVAVPAGRRDPAGPWDRPAPGIECKLLATDSDKQQVSMLVRLAPATDYPPHRHAGVEELFLLHGELWIDERKLFPGDYSRAEPGTADKRVWSETGCTCLLITSTQDVLG